MSGGSTGQYLGYIAGAVLAYVTYGGSYVLTGAAIGGAVGAALDPPKGPTLTGPRINDLTVQTSTYGANIPRDYGTVGHTGNVMWLEGNRLKEVVKKKKSGGKGSGGGSTVKTYTYYATFAVGLADCRHTGPMAGVRRVWVGSKLIYNAGSDDIETIIASNQAAAGFRFYPGSTTQNPDPRMQADIGAANCPAFRGLAYIVLYDYPLADHGNSLLGAPVKVEMVGSGSLPFGVKTIDLPLANNWGPISSSSDRIVMVPSGSAGYTPNAVYGFGPEPYFKTSIENGNIFGMRCLEGVFVAVGGYLGTHPIQYSRDGVTWLSASTPTEALYVFDVNAGDGVYIAVQRYNNGFTAAKTNLAFRAIAPEGPWLSVTLPVSENWRSVAYLNGRWLAISEGGYGAYSDDAGLNWTSFSLPIGTTWYHLDVYQGRFAMIGSSSMGLSDDGLTWTIKSLPVTGNGAAVALGILYVSDGTSSSVKASADEGDTWVSIATPFAVRGMTAMGDTLFCAPAANGSQKILTIYPAIDNSAVQLSNVVQSEILQSGLIDDGDVNLSQLTDDVLGYRVTSTSAIRSALDPLMAVWPFDLILAGYQLKAVRRGGASLMDIPLSHLDARAAGDAIGDRLVKARDMPSQLPTRVVVQYLSAAREYDQGEQRSPDRDTGNTVNITTQSIAVVLDDDEAAGVAETLQALRWLERTDIGPFRLPPIYRGLQPADVVTLVGDGVSYEIRLTSVNLLSDGRLECSAKLNAAPLYTPAAVGAVASDSGRTVGLDGPSAMQLLDIPLLRDEDDSAGFPASMCGYTAAWPGGILYRSSDGGQIWEDLQGFAGPVPIGYARNVLAAGRTDIFDSSNTLVVDLLTGDMESISQLSALAGVNWFAFGSDGRWEIIAAATCTIQPDGSWMLSDLLRGRRGSEWAMSLHQAGDALVAITDGDMAWISMASDSIGASRDYRAITVGKGIDTDTSHSWTYTAVNLKPLSPINANGSRHPTTHDWSLSWTRRGRLSPEWRDSVDMPLGEDSQAWEVDICTDATYATVVRTLSGLTSAAASYSSAQQVADFGSNQATLYLRIVQLSATVGRGFPLQVALTR